MNTKKVEKKVKKPTKSQKKRIEAIKHEVQKPKDSNVEREDVKYRVTFVVGQFFRGVYRQQGEFLDLPENDAKAYVNRSTLKVEKLEE